jgi:uncharacterized protein YjiS (DUF1127 family)
MGGALSPHRTVWHDAPVGSADVSCRHDGLAALRGIIAIWDGRIRLRWKLAQMSRDDPRLIDDIGLTRRQVEAEIAKRFWQA